jgi:hypothetical protein
MTTFEEGQRVMAPDPADERREVEATFVEWGARDEAVYVERSAVQPAQPVDVARVRYDDGSVHAWPYDRVHRIE